MCNGAERVALTAALCDKMARVAATRVKGVRNSGNKFSSCRRRNCMGGRIRWKDWAMVAAAATVTAAAECENGS